MANIVEGNPGTVVRPGSTSGCIALKPPSSHTPVENSSTDTKEVGIAAPNPRKNNGSDFPIGRKHWILFLAGFAALFSPLSSSIYYPAITELSHSFSVSIEMINLTITSYMVVSGVGPALVSDLADHVGRRPVYISTISLYLAANIGLACQKSYPALLALRMLQSLGTSGSISLAFGTVSDLWPPAERGRYVGWVTCGPNLAPTIGPVLGAVFAEKAGWRWIFWFLVMGSGTCLILFILTFPETVHSVRGKIIQPRLFILGRPLFFNFKSHREFQEINAETENVVRSKRKARLYIPNPLASLFILFHPTTALLAAINAIFYATINCVQASLSTEFIAIYQYSTLNAGLLYIPFGIATIIGSYVSGRILDRDYRIIAGHIRSKNQVENGNRIETLAGKRFPIERARLRSIWIMIIIESLGVAGYGWCIAHRVNVSILVIMSICITIPQAIISNQLNTLMTDLHPLVPSTAQASMNIARCSLAAAGLAALQIMIDHLGAGWCFTIFAAFCASTGGLCWAIWVKGEKWRGNLGLREDILGRETIETG